MERLAYDKLLKNKYDLLIMDWMIPEVSGLGFNFLGQKKRSYPIYNPYFNGYSESLIRKALFWVWKQGRMTMWSSLLILMF